MALSAIALQQPTLDPVTFEVLRSLFEYTCVRMSRILQKTSFSPILYDMVDFSNAIYDAVGVRVRDFPFRPDRVLGALQTRATAQG